MEKYRMKKQEAEALNDFIMPMLEYYPEKRISAQELLKHPWLNMPANFDYLMSDREYEKMMMIKKNAKKEKNYNNEETIKQDLIESDIEINMADDEDNEEISGEEESDDSYVDNPDQIHIQNFNNSFAAYGQHVNLAALDSANPQFDKIF
jgi:serine/threonine protein kinase